TRLAGVGVANQRNDREWGSVTLASLLGARAFDLFQPLLEQNDALGDLAPVAFDLGFAGAAHETHAAAAALAFKVGPGPDKPALLIIEMGQLYLQHTLSGSRTFAENFQNQRRPVQHLGAGLLFEITLLDGAERRVDKEEIDVLFLDASGQFL